MDVRGERRHIRDLKRTGRNHNLVGLESPCSEVEDKGVISGCDRLNRAVELHWQFECRSVAFEIVDYLVAAGISIRVARERDARKRVVATRREEHE